MSWLRFAADNSPGQWMDSNQRLPILGRLTRSLSSPQWGQRFFQLRLLKFCYDTPFFVRCTVVCEFL